MLLLLAGFLFLALAPAPPEKNAWFGLIVFLPYPTLGAVVLWHQPRNMIGWLLSLIALGFAVLGCVIGYVHYQVPAFVISVPYHIAFLASLGDSLWFLCLSVLPLIVLIFPDGKPLSRRWSILARLIGWNGVALTLLSLFYPATLLGLPQLHNPLVLPALYASTWRVGFALTLIVLFGELLAALIALLTRLRQATGDERQQIKWFLSGCVYALLTEIATVLIPAWRSYRDVVGDIVAGTGGLCFVLCLGIAMLRYHLYDIDRILNRTLVYGTLSALLVGIYLSLVVVLQWLFHVILGPHTMLAIPLSTLAIAFLFQPLRTFLQTTIDRRFFRRRYDTQHVVAEFSATLLQRITEHALLDDLFVVLEDTVQPSSISLWLRTPLNSIEEESK